MSLGALTSAAKGKLDRAYIEIRQPNLSGAHPTPGAETGRIEFGFNPKELSVSKESNTSSTAQPSKEAPDQQFQGPSPRKMEVEMFFSNTEEGKKHDLLALAERLYSLCEAVPESIAKKKPATPFVTFGWGAFRSKPSFCKSVSVTYQLFTPTGTPLRMTAKLSLEEAPNPTPGQNPTSGTKKLMKTHTLMAGETLASVAYKEYQKASMWRAIAEVNDIDDPTRLVPGMTVFLPPVAEAAELA